MKTALLTAFATTLLTVTGSAAVITATQNGGINTSSTWGGATIPTAGNSDTWDTSGFNMNFGDETFYGGLLNVTGGSRLDGGVGPDLVLQATTFDNGGISMNNNILGTFDFSGQTLTFAGGGADFGSNDNARNINLLNSVWAGSGDLSFSKTGGTGQSWLTVNVGNDMRGYTGTISVDSVNTGNAYLNINGTTNGSFGVVIGTDSVFSTGLSSITLSSLVLGSDTIAAGSYRYADFTTTQQSFLNGGAITGADTITVLVPEPASATLWMLGLAGMLALVKRRQR